MGVFLLWTMLVACLAISGAVKPPNRPGQVVQPTLDARVGELEATTKQLKRKVTVLTTERDIMSERLSAIEERLATHEELIAVEQLLVDSERKNQELTVMLSKFERFFGSLYAETPESFDPTKGINYRLSKLNSYLGNKEAELLSIRPAPPEVVNNATVDQELFGNALYGIEQERSRIEKKVRRLEENLERVSRRVPEHARNQVKQGTFIEDTIDSEEPIVVVPPPSGGSPGQGGSRGNGRGVGGGERVIDCDDCKRKRRSIEETSSEMSLNGSSQSSNEVIARLERLEDLMVLQLLPLINETVGDQSSFRSGEGASATVLNQLAELEELEDEIEAYRSTSRPDSKKVAFSAAMTTHMMGQAGVAQTLQFDYVFLNKGGGFKESNSTFHCTVTGYYLVTFTLRSFDGYVLASHLMKNQDQVTGIATDAHSRNVMDSQTVIVHLETGDTMWLRHPPSKSYAVHSTHYKYSTFSAFLIYKGY